MAWFTDKSLFEQLVDKAKKGIQVQVLIHSDDINGTAGIDYGRLNGKNSTCNLIADRGKTMHHKFCVIDGFTVMHGSYNWTNQAMNNHENLTVTTGDIELAASFISQFFKLKKLQAPNVTDENSSLPEAEKPPASRREARRREKGVGRNNSEIVAKIRARLDERKQRSAGSNDTFPSGETGNNQ
jgi:phosphatidylserine/phosphatidylglycerophosphate/cardiolipin synthase-like enzyme